MKIKDTTSREKMLKAVRRALVQKTKEPFTAVDFEKNVFGELTELPEIDFAQRFSDAGGRFVFCEQLGDVMDNLRFLMKENEWKQVFCFEPTLRNLLEKEKILLAGDYQALSPQDVCLTSCEFLVARHGAILVTSKQLGGRKQLINPKVHLVLARTSQLVNEIKDALKELKNKYENQLPSQITFVSGPSKTADIEGKVITGAQGPEELYLFLLDDLN